MSAMAGRRTEIQSPVASSTRATALVIVGTRLWEAPRLGAPGAFY
jgi:hypothetical protein